MLDIIGLHNKVIPFFIFFSVKFRKVQEINTSFINNKILSTNI